MKYINTNDCAKLIRQSLKEAFPGVKFSVRSSKYSGGSSISVRWEDGPTNKMVDSIASTFKGSYFDGSIDYHGSTYAMIDGEQVRFSADYVFCRRELTEAAKQKINARYARMWGKECNHNDYDDSRHWSYICEDFSFYLAPKESKTANKVIYLGNDGYSRVGALEEAV